MSSPMQPSRSTPRRPDMPGALSLMHLYPINGAVHRVAPTETAWNALAATWTMVIAGIDPDPAAEPRRVGERYWAAVHPHNR